MFFKVKVVILYLYLSTCDLQAQDISYIKIESFSQLGRLVQDFYTSRLG